MKAWTPMNRITNGDIDTISRCKTLVVRGGCLHHTELDIRRSPETKASMSIMQLLRTPLRIQQLQMLLDAKRAPNLGAKCAGSAAVGTRNKRFPFNARVSREAALENRWECKSNESDSHSFPPSRVYPRRNTRATSTRTYVPVRYTNVIRTLYDTRSEASLLFAPWRPSHHERTRRGQLEDERVR